MVLAIFNIGPLELMIMAAAAVMLFGGDLPVTARKAARTIGRLKALASELGREFSAADELPSRKDLQLDLKKLVQLDDTPPVALPPPGPRREDEPLADPTAPETGTAPGDEGDEHLDPGEPPEASGPAVDEAGPRTHWRESLRTEVADDAPVTSTPEASADSGPSSTDTPSGEESARPPLD